MRRFTPDRLIFSEKYDPQAHAWGSFLLPFCTDLYQNVPKRPQTSQNVPICTAIAPQVAPKLPQGKIKTAQNLVVERFSVAEKGGFELPRVCSPVNKNAVFRGLFGVYQFVCPPVMDSTCPKSCPKFEPRVRSIISAVCLFSPSVMWPYTPKVSIETEWPTMSLII